MDDSTSDVTSSRKEEDTANAMMIGDVGSKKRKIESDGGASDDSKKARTAEAEIAGDGVAPPGASVVMAEKRPMMGEGDGKPTEVGNSVTANVEKVGQNADDNTADEIASDSAMVVEEIESAQTKTNDAEVESRMAVDVVPLNTPVVESISSDTTNPAAVDVQSSAADVIDVDAIVSCDEAPKEKSFSSPHEQGLNEYYLKPTAVDSPASNVIDVDDRCDEAQKEKSYGNPLEQGLNEYYLKPTAVDSPATNVIDVDAEPSEAAADNQAVASETSTSVADKSGAGNLRDETSPESVEEKSCTNETSNVSGKTSSKTLDEGKADVADVGTESGDPVATSAPSLVAQNTAQPMDEAIEDANKLIKDVGASADAGPNAGPEMSGSTERKKLGSSDTDEMVAEVTGPATAERECTGAGSTDADKEVTEAGQAEKSGNVTEAELENQKVELEVEVVAATKTLPSEDVSSIGKTGEGFEKSAENVDVGCGTDEKVADSIETSSAEAPTALNQAQTETAKTEIATDSMDVTDKAGSGTAELMEMTDKSVSEVEPGIQPTEVMDTAVVDSKGVDEQEEISDSVEVSVDSEEELTENVTEVVPSKGMGQLSEDVEQSMELSKKVDISVPTDVTAMEAADETTKGEGVQTKDVSDKSVSGAAEVIGKAAASEDPVSQCNEAADSLERSPQPAEADHSRDAAVIKGAAVGGNTAATDDAVTVVACANGKTDSE